MQKFDSLAALAVLRAGVDAAFARGDDEQAAPRKFRLAHLVLALGLTLGLGSHAQTAPAQGADHATHHPAAAAPPIDGEVRKVDREQGKVTLKHGPLTNLEMPAMTMVFKVADPKMLDGIKEGDKVRFTADKVDGALTVTAIEPAK